MAVPQQGRSDAEAILAEARKAFQVMVGVLVLIWLIQVVNALTDYALTDNFGSRARDLSSLPGLFSAPFLHAGWDHIEHNSGPLFIFGFLAAYRGVRKFFWVSVLIMVVSGGAAWFLEPSGSAGVGASGMVFGYFGYVVVRGLFDRHGTDIVVGLVMALCFAYLFIQIFPGDDPRISWQAHMFGLIGGVVGGWIFRERRARPAIDATPPTLTLPDAT